MLRDFAQTTTLLLTTYLVRIVGTKEHGDKCEPYHNCGVHSKADKLGLVEIFRDFPSFHCIDCASCDKNHIVD